MCILLLTQASNFRQFPGFYTLYTPLYTLSVSIYSRVKHPNPLACFTFQNSKYPPPAAYVKDTHQPPPKKWCYNLHASTEYIHDYFQRNTEYHIYKFITFSISNM